MSKDIAHAFIIALLALDIGASISFAWALDWRRAVYWFCAATLTYVVTF